jgi:hypothetical protein
MTPQDPRTDAAVSDWEAEGGNTAIPVDAPAEWLPCLPPLPSGCDAQEAWGFTDPTGDFAYEFCRVYGPPEGGGARGTLCRLDQERSYWVVFWRAQEVSGNHPASRWLTYAQARALSPSGLTFRRFASSADMREEIPRLLQVAEIVLDRDRAVSPGWLKAS